MEFDDRGFYPQHDCKRCGKPLHGADSGYPAELYAGTYTGLCYPCTAEKPYLVHVSLLDGAMTYNHPPSNSAYRRNRENYVYYDGCSCNLGAVRKSGRYGDYYTLQCEDCSRIYYTEPWRVWYNNIVRKMWRAAENTYNNRMIKAGIFKRVRGKIVVLREDDEAKSFVESTSRDVLKRHRDLAFRLEKRNNLHEGRWS